MQAARRSNACFQKHVPLSHGVQVRTAGCVWLVALASFTGRQRTLLGRLGELQEAFTALLGDASETVQEMASRGLSLVYTLGDRGAQEQLLASLMGTLQGAAPAPGQLCSTRLETV